MSEGCPGCFQSVKGQQRELERIKTLAKQYANENNTTVAIYKEGFEFFYCTAERAVDSGYAIVCFVAQDHGTAS